MQYTIQQTDNLPAVTVDPEPASAWQSVPELDVGVFHVNSTDHRPLTTVQIVHNNEALCLRFRVQDRYVYCTRTDYQDSVCRDACVEFFTQPKPDAGYFNFEINCIGTLLLQYHQRPDLNAGSEELHVEIPAAEAAGINIATSITAPVATEIADATDWEVVMQIPVSVLEKYVGSLQPLSGSNWNANFYKCASDCSQPHWASWSPILEQLNFHNPLTFAPIQFA